MIRLNTIEEALIAVLEADSALDTLLGATASDSRIFDWDTPQVLLTATYPAHIWYEFKSEETPRLSSQQLPDMAVFFHIKANTRALRGQIIARLDDLLDGKGDFLDETTKYRGLRIRRMGAEDDFDTTHGGYTATVGYEIHDVHSLEA